MGVGGSGVGVANEHGEMSFPCAFGKRDYARLLECFVCVCHLGGWQAGQLCPRFRIHVSVVQANSGASTALHCIAAPFGCWLAGAHRCCCLETLAGAAAATRLPVTS